MSPILEVSDGMSEVDGRAEGKEVEEEAGEDEWTSASVSAVVDTTVRAGTSAVASASAVTFSSSRAVTFSSALVTAVKPSSLLANAVSVAGAEEGAEDEGSGGLLNGKGKTKAREGRFVPDAAAVVVEVVVSVGIPAEKEDTAPNGVDVDATPNSELDAGTADATEGNVNGKPLVPAAVVVVVETGNEEGKGVAGAVTDAVKVGVKANGLENGEVEEVVDVVVVVDTDEEPGSTTPKGVVVAADMPAENEGATPNSVDVVRIEFAGTADAFEAEENVNVGKLYVAVVVAVGIGNKEGTGVSGTVTDAGKVGGKVDVKANG